MGSSRAGGCGWIVEDGGEFWERVVGFSGRVEVVRKRVGSFWVLKGI